tara:strand:- start:3970 stop:5067 length:1098 start_codon:yes stop_codon:yes gene_type:complete
MPDQEHARQSPTMNTYHLLRPALDDAGATNRIFARDLNKTGTKEFMVATMATFQTIYATTSRKHWYECLREDCPSRLFLDVESASVVDVAALTHYMQKCSRAMFGIDGSFQVLDACSDQKTSYHFIGSLVFKNVYHVGAFVRRVLLAMHAENTPERHAIDHAVYTRNRLFRIKGSTKFGSDRTLLHEKPWDELLVQLGHSNTTDTVLECLEIDGGTPRSTSKHPLDMFMRNPDGSWAATGRSRAVRVRTELTDVYPLTPVMDWLDQHADAATMRYSIQILDDGRVVVPSRSKCCKIADRTHKGNHIWFCIDANTMRVTQKCYDSVCAGFGHHVQVPMSAWGRWLNIWSIPVVIPNNEKTLFNTSH